MKRCRPALGTYVEIKLPHAGEDAADAAAAIAAAYQAIERVDGCMSFHREQSDLSRINRAAPGTTLAVDPWTVEVLRLAVELERESDGLFDCAIGAEMIEAGLLPGAIRQEGSGSLARSLDFLDATHVRVEARLCLDLGGIAKGDAVDRAIDVLRAYGVRQATVNAGGDLRVMGAEAEPIHVRSAGSPACFLFQGELREGAIATSGRFVGSADASGPPGGRPQCALFDPRTRAPLAVSRSYSVLADRCAVADGLTKVVAASGITDHPSLRRYGATAFIT